MIGVPNHAGIRLQVLRFTAPSTLLAQGSLSEDGAVFPLASETSYLKVSPKYMILVASADLESNIWNRDEPEAHGYKGREQHKSEGLEK